MNINHSLLVLIEPVSYNISKNSRQFNYERTGKMNIKICKNISKYRKENQMTQAQVAEYLGVSPQAVSKWEQEAAMPDIFLIPKIAFLFNVSIDTLFGTSSLETADALVGRYSVVRNDSHYKEAKEALDVLLEMNPEDSKALGLLVHLEYQKALEYLYKSRELCEKLSQSKSWEKRAKMQMMRIDSMLGNYDFVDECKKRFAMTQSLEDFNYLIVALGEKHQYKETLELAKKHAATYDKELIYPNLLEAAFQLGDLDKGKMYFDLLKDVSDESQVFNAWWLMWKLHKKLNHEDTGFYREEVRKRLPDQGYSEYFYEHMLQHLNDEKEKPATIL